MHKVGRFIPPDRDVLKDISLFYPGAKIGVLGPNGAGKSTLLRIMAGIDQEYTGEARLTDGFTVGMLEQEPKLDPAKDVMGNVMDGVARSRACSRSTRRCSPGGPIPMPTTTSSEPARPTWSRRSRPRARGTSSATSRSRWTRCARRRATPLSTTSRAARPVG
ncbi:MAG: ATP-binding cassette domain-containing protein [Acidimicrobiales bacterium]